MRSKIVEQSLESLLHEFGNRRWKRSFNRHDIQSLIKRKPRTAEAVLQVGIDHGLFTKTNVGYKLTNSGYKKITDVNQDVNRAPNLQKQDQVKTHIPTHTYTKINSELTKKHENSELTQESELTCKSFAYTENSELTHFQNSQVSEITKKKSELTSPEDTTYKYNKIISNLDNNNKYINCVRARSKPHANFEKTKKKKKRTKADIANELIASGAKNEKDKGKAIRMRGEFESRMREYFGYGPFWKFKDSGEMSDKICGFFEKACAIAADLEVDYETYVNAQFYWFHQWFRTVPRVWNLCRGDAKLRVQMFLRIRDSQSANVTSADMGPVKISNESKQAYSVQNLHMLMRNYQATEEEILRVFGVGKLSKQYFERKWLKQNETFKRLQVEGEI